MSPVRSVSGDDGRYFGSSRPPRLAICVCVLICVGLAVALGASAAPPAARSRTYDLQFAPAALGEGQPAITISGGRVTRFFVAVPVACAPPAEYEFVMSLPTPAAVADGHFSFSGDLRSADPRAGGQFSISGTITPGGDLVSGTATLSNMHSGPFSGCSESYRFLGLPAAAAVTAPPTPVPQDRNFASRYISFDYTHHAVGRGHLNWLWTLELAPPPSDLLLTVSGSSSSSGRRRKGWVRAWSCSSRSDAITIGRGCRSGR
jgi:hypothetical protein